MLTRENMKGLYILIITPMNEDMSVDYEGHRANVRQLVEMGVDGVILNGTNGEFHTCTDEERYKLTEILVEEAKGKLMCLAGGSSINTADAIRRAKRYQDIGADGIMNVVPYYLPPTKDECIQYFRDLAEAVPDLGIILYNNPMTTQIKFTDDDYVRLEDVPNFVGSKMQGGDIWSYLNVLRRTTTKHFPLEQLWGVSNAVGGPGVMASFIYSCPGFMMRWWKAISGGDLQTALKMQHEVNELLQEVVLPPFGRGASEVAGTKGFVEAMGHWACGKSRKPFFPVPQKDIDHMRQQVKDRYPQFLD